MTDDQVALALQTALLGEVFPALRGAGFNLDADYVRVVFFHEGELAEVDRESVACIETELMAMLPLSAKVSAAIVRADVPGILPDPDRWVYRRRE